MFVLGDIYLYVLIQILLFMGYTKEECYEIAKSCIDRREFKKNYPQIYYYALKNNYDYEYFWFKPRRKPKGYWTKDKCLEESKKYETTRDFQKLSSGAYDAARKNGWLKNYTWLKMYAVVVLNKLPNGYWSYEKCYQEALKYKSKKEFAINSCSAYDSAYRHGWLDDYFWLNVIDNNIFTGKADCVYAYEFKDRKAVYVGRTLMKRQSERHKEHCEDTDLIKKYAVEIGVSVPPMKILQDNLTLNEGIKLEGEWLKRYIQNGWVILNKAKTGSIGSLKIWYFEKCKKIAMKYQTLHDFRIKDKNAYRVAKDSGWLKKFDWLEHGILPGYWNNKENCIEESKKYKSRGEFCNGSNGAYNSALKHKWLDEFTWLTPKCKERGYWDNKENCKAVAITCKNRKEFKLKSNRGYNISRLNGWLDEFFPK